MLVNEAEQYLLGNTKNRFIVDLQNNKLSFH